MEQVTEKQLIDALDKYLEQLHNSKTVTPAKFHYMQLALYGAKCIINDAFGTKRTTQMAMIK